MNVTACRCRSNKSIFSYARREQLHFGFNRDYIFDGWRRREESAGEWKKKTKKLVTSETTTQATALKLSRVARGKVRSEKDKLWWARTAAGQRGNIVCVIRKLPRRIYKREIPKKKTTKKIMIKRRFFLPFSILPTLRDFKALLFARAACRSSTKKNKKQCDNKKTIEIKRQH